MQKFTDAFIRGLKPKDKRYVVREEGRAGERGFCIRVMPTGGKSWQMIYTVDGARKWNHLGDYPKTSLSEARAKFRKALDCLKAGIDPGEKKRAENQERRDAWTINKLCDEFLEKHAKVKKRPRSAREDELNLARDVRPTWGKKKARDIRRGDVVSLLDEIVNRGSGVQANRTLATVRKMFAWGLEREAVELNPAAGISKPAPETPKERALSLEEIKTVWQTMDDQTDVPEGVKKALKLVLLTGLRPGEVVAAKWDQIDGEWLDLPGASTKNRRPHRAYLSTLARQVAGDPGEGLMITKDDGSPLPVYSLSFWLRRCRHFGIDRWTPHDLRRTCATRLAEMGTAPHVVQRILNHVQSGVTGRVYDQHTYSAEKQQALEAWGRKLENLIADRHTDNVINFHQRGQ